MGKKKVRHLTAVGCHIYAGGFTLGVREHFDVLAHLEEWKFGVETVRQNLKLPVHVGAPESWPVGDYVDEVDFVFCNPPCAPWSQLRGKDGADWRGNPQVQHWVNCLDLLDRIKPTVLAIESVRGVYKRGRDMLDPRIAAAMRRGYRATHVLCNGLEHGVPQSRPRYFLVLSQVELPWEPTRLRRDATIADAWRAAFKTHTNGKDKDALIKLIKRAKPGEDLRRTFDRNTPHDKVKEVGGRIAGRPPFAYKRLRSEGQSHVITGGRNFIHPSEHRFISVEEQAALCGYPRWYRFVGSPTQQYPQVGKAVMPPVGEYLARIVAAGIREKRRPLTMMPEEVTIWRDRVERQDVGLEHKASGFKVAQASARPMVVTKDGAQRAPRPARQGIGHFIRTMLKDGKDARTILTAVHKKFPESKAKESDVYWNKRKLEAQGGVP